MISDERTGPEKPEPMLSSGGDVSIRELTNTPLNHHKKLENRKRWKDDIDHAAQFHSQHTIERVSLRTDSAR